MAICFQNIYRGTQRPTATCSAEWEGSLYRPRLRGLWNWWLLGWNWRRWLSICWSRCWLWRRLWPEEGWTNLSWLVFIVSLKGSSWLPRWRRRAWRRWRLLRAHKEYSKGGRSTFAIWSAHPYIWWTIESNSLRCLHSFS